MHIKTDRTRFARLQALPLRDAAITGGFWADKQTLNGQVTLWHGYDMLEKAGHAVPYFAWANRDAGAMRVWLPYHF